MNRSLTNAALIGLLLLVKTALAARYALVPKNKPAKISTKIYSWENPMLGNDGDTDGKLVHGSQCFHTDPADTLPWWMLDMEQVYLVSGAVLWNRLSTDYPDLNDRASRLSVAVSSNAAVWTSFNKDLFDLCAYYGGTPTVDGNPINLTCVQPVAGRYFAIYKNVSGLTDKSFHLCEIDILTIVSTGTNLTEFFSRGQQPSFIPPAATRPYMTSQSVSYLAECAALCRDNILCRYFLFSGANRNCSMFQYSSIPSDFIGMWNGKEAGGFWKFSG